MLLSDRERAKMSSDVAPIVSSSVCFVSFVVCLGILLIVATRKKATAIPGANAPGAVAGCKPRQADCAYTTRQLTEGKWVCPLGYEDTGCGSKDGRQMEKLQCRACGTESPYFAYGIANPNCPAGWIPCNDPAFNHGDLKRKSNGGWAYSPGWGVDDPGYDWEGAGIDYLGGSITLNKGKWGGTDAHPEVFAKGCCQRGNSLDDPERDKANSAIQWLIKAAATVVGSVAIPFTGGQSLHGTLAVMAGESALSSSVSAKCGGPTVKYKEGKTKGRDYFFKAPYNDVGHGMEKTQKKMRGSPGLWYSAKDGCPLKWMAYTALSAPAK